MSFRLSDRPADWILRPPWARDYPSVKAGCVLWVGRASSTRTGPRPVAVDEGKQATVARLLLHPPTGMDACHSCDCGRCISIDHLWVGTRGDNMRDAARKGRTRNINSAKTHCILGHPLSGDNLIVKPKPQSRRHYLGAAEWRACRTCQRDGQRRRRASAAGG